MDMRPAAYGMAIGVSLLIGTGTLRAAADDQPSSSFIVRVSDRTSTSPDVVIHAMRIASTIYRRIGVGIIWVEWDHPKASDSRFRRLGLVIDTGRMVHDSNASPEVMGFAPGAPDARAEMAFVLYDRVRENARRQRVEIGTLLGHVIAHELGHLLLPAPSHAQDGIMRGRWQHRDFEMAGRGQLFFEGPQGALIRRALAPIDGDDQSPVRTMARAAFPGQDARGRD